MSKPPDKLYLQWYGDGEPGDIEEVSEHDATWCMDKIFPHDIEYVRIDKSEVARLRKAIEEMPPITGFLLTDKQAFDKWKRNALEGK